MVTIFLFWKAVTGAEVITAYYLCCMVVFAVFLLRLKRRIPSLSRAKCLASVLLPSAVCDLVWYLFYFRNGDYINHGLMRAALPLLLLPVLLLLAYWTLRATGYRKH